MGPSSHARAGTIGGLVPQTKVQTTTRPVISAVLMFLQAGLFSADGAETVRIPDRALNAAVRAALRKPTGALSTQDLLLLTELSASGRGIQSVAGLERARNLTSLNL